jgi:hypothetical protein
MALSLAVLDLFTQNWLWALIFGVAGGTGTVAYVQSVRRWKCAPAAVLRPWGPVLAWALLVSALAFGAIFAFG